MASLKALAGQTVWYGFSNIAARFLTYLLTPFLTNVLTGARGQVEWGRYGYLYALFPVLNVLFTYGMETAYFRYSRSEDQSTLYRTQLSAMLLSTGLLCGMILLFRHPLAGFATVADRPEYIGWCAAIVGLDALSALPYARLRRENRPRWYAFTKVVGILVFTGAIFGLYTAGPRLAAHSEGFAAFYDRYWGLGFILLANLLQAIVTLLLLAREWRDFRPQVNGEVLRRVLRYGLPILITGFAGVMNESLNRIMFQKIHPGTEDDNLRLLGYLTAALRLATFINLAIQAFKMAAEPFFFSISGDRNAPGTYARVMKWFVITLLGMALGILLFMDVWKHFVGSEYRQALDLVPVLLFAYVFLGVYYNLTVWYKLTDKTEYGTYITLLGAAVTVAFNWALIPVLGYAACAWGMFVSYGFMMVLCYTWGQRHYRIPYATRKMGGYLGIALGLFGAQVLVYRYLPLLPLRLLTGAVLLALFGASVYQIEREELRRFPVIGKWVR